MLKGGGLLKARNLTKSRKREPGSPPGNVTFSQKGNGAGRPDSGKRPRMGDGLGDHPARKKPCRYRRKDETEGHKKTQGTPH